MDFEDILSVAFEAHRAILFVVENDARLVGLHPVCLLDFPILGKFPFDLTSVVVRAANLLLFPGHLEAPRIFFDFEALNFSWPLRYWR